MSKKRKKHRQKNASNRENQKYSSTSNIPEIKSPVEITPRKAWGLLWAASILSVILYAAITYFSKAFDASLPEASIVAEINRPMLTVAGLFVGVFVLYFLTLWVVLRTQASRKLIGWVLGTSLLFRAVLLPSIPIQEIDLYRYIWDGEVVAAGQNPFQFAPQTVVNALKNFEETGISPQNPQLETLVNNAYHHQGLAQVLRTIHYSELPTVYPPVSQAVFALSALSTPDDSTIFVRRTIMKFWLVLFDFATLGVLLYLLRLTGKHPGWAIAYGWCPLVIKEFANSGHLDSITVFLSMLAIALFVRLLKRHTPLDFSKDIALQKHNKKEGETSKKQAIPWGGLALISIVWAASIGAKLYPVALFACFGFFVLRWFGWKALLLNVGIVGLLSVMFLLPMLRRSASTTVSPDATVSNGIAPPLVKSVNPSDGLVAFLSRWEMNDFLFMNVVENLRSQESVQEGKRPWFVITDEENKQENLSEWSRRFERFQARWGKAGANRKPMSPTMSSFILARMITFVFFLGITLVTAWRGSRVVHSEQAIENFLRSAFLAFAWFWLLSPTQNPWYWTWALPLIPFARCKTWLAMAALVMLYYSRFWFRSHLATTAVLGTPYQGEYFFHFVIVWLEYFPWYLMLLSESLWQSFFRRKGPRGK